MDSILHEFEENSGESEATTREITGGGAMAAKKTSARSRTPANVIRVHDVDYVQGETGELVSYVPPPPRGSLREIVPALRRTVIGVMAAAGGSKKLMAIVEGKETVTKEQLQAHMAVGRSKGWNRRPLRQEIACVGIASWSPIAAPDRN